MFSNQTGKILHTTSKAKNYQIIVHNIYFKSTWIETMKNRAEGETILAWRRALAWMKLSRIVPKHQVLYNKIPAAYEAEIQGTHMTYQIFLPDDLRRNIAEKAIQN